MAISKRSCDLRSREQLPTESAIERIDRRDLRPALAGSNLRLATCVSRERLPRAKRSALVANLSRINVKIIGAIEESLEGAANTGMYFEYINSKGLEVLQQEILGKLKCSNCGWCCSSCNVLLSEDDIITLCKHLGCDFNQFYEKYMDKDTLMNYLAFPCPFLDMSKENEKCIIYEVRPKVCRHFPFNASLLNVDPCIIGKDIKAIVDDKIAEKMMDKMSKKGLEGLKEKLKKDEEKAKGAMAIYDRLDAFLPQFNEVYGHLVAVIDRDLLLKIAKELKNR